jgi:hypothetical protein
VGVSELVNLLRQPVSILVLYTTFNLPNLDKMGVTITDDAQPVASSSKGRIAVDMDDVLWSVRCPTGMARAEPRGRADLLVRPT